MRRLALLGTCFAGAPLAAAAQNSSSSGMTTVWDSVALAHPVRSPEVGVDPRFTFRLCAPKAAEVSVAGEFMDGSLSLVKNDNDVWGVAGGSLAPRSYNLRTDSMKATRPQNTSVKISSTASTISDVLAASGDSYVFYNAQPVSHGWIRTLWHDSKSRHSILFNSISESFATDLVNDAIPFIQKHFSAYTDHDYRAVSIPSGRVELFAIGLSHLGLRSYVRGLSATDRPVGLEDGSGSFIVTQSPARHRVFSGLAAELMTSYSALCEASSHFSTTPKSRTRFAKCQAHRSGLSGAVSLPSSHRDCFRSCQERNVMRDFVKQRYVPERFALTAFAQTGEAAADSQLTARRFVSAVDERR